MERATSTPVPRGRHAPPLEVRRGAQRERLLAAAATEVARDGYANASAEAISRAAGMSKATFYEHFANKEACVLALYDAAAERVLSAMAAAAAAAGDDTEARLRAGIGAFVEMLATHPDEGQALLVEILAVGPQVAERRDAVLSRFAEVLLAESRHAERHGAPGRYASELEVYALVAGICELAARALRLGEVSDVRELRPVVERLLLGATPA